MNEDHVHLIQLVPRIMLDKNLSQVKACLSLSLYVKGAINIVILACWSLPLFACLALNVCHVDPEDLSSSTQLNLADTFNVDLSDLLELTSSFSLFFLSFSDALRIKWYLFTCSINFGFAPKRRRPDISTQCLKIDQIVMEELSRFLWEHCESGLAFRLCEGVREDFYGAHAWLQFVGE